MLTECMVDIQKPVTFLHTNKGESWKIKLKKQYQLQ